MSKYSGLITRLRNRLNSLKDNTTSKDLLLYLVFVCIAFVFWMLLSLDNEVQRDFDVPLTVTDCPDSVTVILNVPSSLNVSVKAKGSQLIRFMWTKNLPPIKLKFSENLRSKSQFFVSRSRLDAKLRDYFGGAVQIVSCRPDSLKMLYTTRKGVKLPLRINADIHPRLQYIVSGPIVASTDSVTVYSLTDLPRGLKEIHTEPLVGNDLKDTTRFEVRVQPVEGMRMVPDMVTLTVPVEPLIAKKRNVTVEAVNVPSDVSIVLFPGSVEVSYLVPMSEYSADIPVRVIADYNATQKKVARLPLTVAVKPGIAHNVSMAVDSVEYIIEHK